MDADSLREYLLSKQATTEEQPFGPEVMVYKVKGKMFATLGFEIEDGIETARTNLKCDPERAIELRAEHDAIVPGYHMNKKHWNTVILDGTLKPDLIRDLIDHSRELVVAGLPAKVRQTLDES